MNLTPWLDTGFAILWRCSWQAGITVILILACRYLFRRWISPAWKTALWWLVLLRLAIPVIPASNWSLYNVFPVIPGIIRDWLAQGTVPQPAARPAAQNSKMPIGGVMILPEPGAPRALDSLTAEDHSVKAWGRLFAIVWLSGTSLMLLRLAGGCLALRSRLRLARPVTDPAVLKLMLDCSQVIKLKRMPRLLETDDLEGPALAGFTRPALLLPLLVHTNLHADELRHVFLHELCHVRRRDPLWNGLAALLRAFHWFNPLVWIGFSQMAADRELATDAAALSSMQPGENRAYGLTILKLLQRLVPKPSAPGIVGIVENRYYMKQRMDLIASFKIKRISPLPPFAVCAAIAVATLTDAQPLNYRSHPELAPIETQTGSTAMAIAGRDGLESREIQIDRDHLLAIHAAIRAYFKDHKDLPKWLSELVPQYLPDADVLISPTEKRTRKSVLFGREDPKLHTSYIYEFNGGPAPEEFNKGRVVPITCKEWKLMQLSKFGLVTPLLSCHVHSRVLNLAYSGDFYETGSAWENDSQTTALIKKNPALGPVATISSNQVLKVQIVDADTEQPLAKAHVRLGLGSEFGLLPTQNLATDTRGDCLFPLGEWGVNWISIKATADNGHLPLELFWDRKKNGDTSAPSEVVIRLQRQALADNSHSPSP